jgi:hypothetical protein
VFWERYDYRSIVLGNFYSALTICQCFCGGIMEAIPGLSHFRLSLWNHITLSNPRNITWPRSVGVMTVRLRGFHPEKQVFGRPACTSQFVIHEACPSTRIRTRESFFFLVQQISCQPARETHQIVWKYGMVLAGCLSGLYPSEVTDRSGVVWAVYCQGKWFDLKGKALLLYAKLPCIARSPFDFLSRA